MPLVGSTDRIDARPNVMSSLSPVCAAEVLSENVFSLQSYGNPRERSYTLISGSNHTALMDPDHISGVQGLCRKGHICSQE